MSSAVRVCGFVLCVVLCVSCSARPRALLHHDVPPDAGARMTDGGADANLTQSPLAIENQADGSDDWTLTQAATDQLMGYASAASVASGDAVTLFVNVDQAQGVRWELYRVGYYQGHGARQIATGDSQPIDVQATCPIEATTGLIECHWQPSFHVSTDPAWLSGYYVFKLISDAGYQAYVPLIVRESMRRAPILVQASVNTWQAYNLWGGTSLYKNTSRDPTYTANRAQRVSFDRPYDRQNSPFFAEARLVRFLEQRGYDVSYTTNLDVEGDRTLLDGRKLFITALHDEYWSVGERDALDAARDGGVSLAFLSANTGYWRVRLDPSSDGVPRRIITCYKSAQLDPEQEAADTTAEFRAHPFPDPENALLGEMYGDWSDFPGFPFVVKNHGHWLYAGTGVAERATLTAIVGIEWDGVVDNGLTPAGLEIVGDSPVINQVGAPVAAAQASVYYPTDHSLVFAAGSIDWIAGLDGPSADPRVQRMAENLLARVGFVLPTPTQVPELDELPVAVPQAQLLAGSGAPGFADGAANTAQFNSPAGVARAPDGDVYVTDTGNALLRKITPDGQVSSVAGCSPDGTLRSSDCFDTPIGIAVDADGVVYVSDSGQQRIWAVHADGSMMPFAGSGTQGFTDSDDASSARFSDPRGLSIGPAGELYVADFGNDAIRCVSAGHVTTLVRSVSTVSGVAADSDGKVYFVSMNGMRIGVVESGVARSLSDEKLKPLEGIALRDGTLLFSDTGEYQVRKLALDSSDPSVVVLGDGRFASDLGHVVLPRGLARTDQGLLVADSGNHRIVFLPDR
jgi:hypothetical protein